MGQLYIATTIGQSSKGWISQLSHEATVSSRTVHKGVKELEIGAAYKPFVGLHIINIRIIYKSESFLKKCGRRRGSDLKTLSVQQSVIHPEIALKEPLNVVIVVTYAYPYVGSGLGVVVKFQAEYLASRGHNVTVISSNIPQASKIFVLNKVTYIKVPAVALLERLHIPVPILFFNKRVISAIRNADIVHVHDILYPSSLVAALLAKFYKKRVVLTQHVPHVQYSNRLINSIEKLAFYTIGLLTLRASNESIVLNTSVQKWISQYKNEVHYLPNGVDSKLFKKSTEQEKQTIRERYNIPLDKFVVLFVGRFVPKKGFNTLYNAKDPSYLILFVGGGIIPKYIKSDDAVRIIGPLPQEELALLYRASDVFVLPSFGEGFPLSIQEAMSSGLPIITSKYNNLDQIRDNPSIAFIDITEADIKSTIKRIQSNTILRKYMGNQASKIAKENFSWDNNITKLLEIYYKSDGIK